MRNAILFVVFLILAVFSAYGQNIKSGFRIVGYYSLSAAMNANLDSFPFDKLTHINLFFLNPDSTGNFRQDLASLAPFIRAAHKNNIKVLPSIAGGGRHEYYHYLLREKRKKLVEDLTAIVVEHNFDGLDVDLEGADIDENYEAFVVELAASLKPQNKILTAAIAVFYKDQFSDKALAQYDFMNVMSYDHTGPWAPSKPGPHSTYDHAVADLAYFINERKIPGSKLTLGVGFYGYGFGPEISSAPVSMSYRELLRLYPNAHGSDEQLLSSGATFYYNGMETIRKKNILAKKLASGIMIWQLMGDATGDKSLLSAINSMH
jgi:GH18 family chitinase